MGRGACARVRAGEMEQKLHGVQICQICPMTLLIPVMSSVASCTGKTHSQVPPSGVRVCICVWRCVCEWITRLPTRWATGVKIRCEVYVWEITNMWPNHSHSTFPSTQLFPLSHFFLLFWEHIFPTAWVNLRECKYWTIQIPNGFLSFGNSYFACLILHK